MKRFLIVARDFPCNPTAYWMDWEEVLAYAVERCGADPDYTKPLLLDKDDERSTKTVVAEYLSRRQWVLVERWTPDDADSWSPAERVAYNERIARSRGEG